jgi:hypothetical protein
MRGSATTWKERPCLICLCIPSNRFFACHFWSLISCFSACRLDMPDCDCMLKTVEAMGEDSEGAIVAAHGGTSPESAVERRATCNSSGIRRLRIARDGSPGQTEAEGDQLRRSRSQAFSSLRARGNDALWRRATCSSSCRASQRSGVWIVRDVRAHASAHRLLAHSTEAYNDDIHVFMDSQAAIRRLRKIISCRRPKVLPQDNSARQDVLAVKRSRCTVHYRKKHKNIQQRGFASDHPPNLTTNPPVSCLNRAERTGSLTCVI